MNVGAAVCTLTSVTDTQIECSLGPNSAGPQSIVAKRTDQGSSNANVQYAYALAVSSLSASEGSIGGGLSLVLSGSGFSPNTSVQICSKPCRYTTSTAASLTCLVPEADNKSQDSTCDVRVAENGKSVTSSFTYRLSLTPTLASVSPTKGGTGGGMWVCLL